jgi:orotate phosphoribosyltransferase
MPANRDLAKAVFDSSFLEGHFVLRSGITSNEYFDKYQFESDPALLSQIIAGLIPLIPEDTEVLAGLEMGGVPIATGLSLQTGLPCAFVRKEAKKYGTSKIAEGASVAGKRVLVVEDVITSAGQVVLSTAELRKAGAIVTTAICVVDREQGGQERLAEAELRLIPLFTADELRAAGAAG